MVILRLEERVKRRDEETRAEFEKSWSTKNLSRPPKGTPPTMLSSSADQLSLPLPYMDEEFQGPFSTSHVDLESTQQESSHSQSQTKTTSGFPLPASSSTVLTGSLSHLEHLSLAELENLIDLKVGVIYFALFPLKLDSDEGGRSLPFLRGACLVLPLIVLFDLFPQTFPISSS
jgi:hypothetical protein